MQIREAALTEALLETLIGMSAAWEAEDNCRGYRKNERADIEGNRIFIAEEGGETVGYLLGHVENAKKSSSVMADGTPCFELEELYVVPDLRSQGVGRRLFEYAEAAVRRDAEYIMVSTATKNWSAILHFYIDELGMDFWSARLFKRLV